jgi:hypothetical protein
MSTATRENARVGATLFDLLIGPLRSSCGLAPALAYLAAARGRVLEVACGISAPPGAPSAFAVSSPSSASPAVLVKYTPAGYRFNKVTVNH